jgi:hypothetical protein
MCYYIHELSTAIYEPAQAWQQRFAPGLGDSAHARFANENRVQMNVSYTVTINDATLRPRTGFWCYTSPHERALCNVRVPQRKR